MGNGTIIDSLIVTLGLDPKNFSKGSQKYTEDLRKMEKQSEKTNKQLSHDTGKTDEAITKLTNKTLGLVTSFLSVGAITAFAQQITKLDAATSRAAKNTGTTTEDLTVVGGMMHQLGGETGQAAQDMAMFSNAIANINLSGSVSPAITFFRNLGVEIDDVTHTKAKPLLQILKETRKAIQDNKMTAPNAQALGRAAGVSESFMNLALLNEHDFAKMEDEQRKLFILKGPQGENAQARQTEFAKLESAIRQYGTNEVDNMTPALLAISGGVTKIVQWLDSYIHKKAPAGSELASVSFMKKIAFFARGGNERGAGKWDDREKELADMVIQKESASSGGYGAINTDKSNLSKEENASSGGYGAINTDKSNLSKEEKKKFQSAMNAGEISISEVIQDEKDNLYQAAGAYQFRGTTLDEVYKKIGLKPTDPFNKENQDKMFNYLFKQSTEGKSIDEQIKSLRGRWQGLNGYSDDELKKTLMNNGVSGSTSTSSSDIHINNLNVHTQATDAQGIAGDIIPQLVAQANTAYS